MLGVTRISSLRSPWNLFSPMYGEFLEPSSGYSNDYIIFHTGNVEFPSCAMAIFRFAMWRSSSAGAKFLITMKLLSVCNKTLSSTTRDAFMCI